MAGNNGIDRIEFCTNEDRREEKEIGTGGREELAIPLGGVVPLRNYGVDSSVSFIIFDNCLQVTSDVCVKQLVLARLAAATRALFLVVFL